MSTVGPSEMIQIVTSDLVKHEAEMVDWLEEHGDEHPGVPYVMEALAGIRVNLGRLRLMADLP